MHTRMAVYGTSQSTKVVSFELTTCINDGFICHSTLESGSDLSDELLVGNDVTFETISPDQISTFFTGTIFEVCSGMTSEHTYSHQLTLMPRIELLKQTEKSQVFVQINVQSLINTLILKAGYSQDRIKWRVTKDLPTLPQCVQALENDYTFFTRLLAKYGLIYWFECHDFTESIVIAEGNLASPYIERGLLSVTDKDGLVHEHGTGFVGFTLCHSRHRFRMGGSQVHVNAHPPTSVSSAQRSYFEPAAQNPAEQFERTGNLDLAYQQGKNEVTLVGNVTEALAGYSFSLNGKLGTAKGGDYTCIRSKQIYKQGSANNPDQVDHRTESVCVPRGEPIRIAPPEHSPKPMVFTATVRSLSGSKTNPHVDTQGQYATQVHFDDQVTESIKRLTQYVCRGQKQPTGLHFPLLPNSNVLIGCMNNDPDQSYLLGFALNDTQPSVVTSANNTQNVLCSRGQNLLMFDDTPNTPHIVLQTLAGNQHLVLHGDKKQPYIHWLAQLGAMNIFAAKDIQLGSVKSAIRLLTNKTFIASAKQQLALESKKSVIVDAATNLDVTANQIGVNAKQNITLKAGRSHRSVIQSDINLKADNNLTITAPAGSQIIQSQGNITIKGSGSGNLTLANGGSEISIDSSGNVNIFANKLLTLKGKAMTVFDGSMEQDIGGKQSGRSPNVAQVAQTAANQRLSLTADGAASLADKTIDLSYFYSDGTPVEDINYEVVMDNGKKYTGQLSGGTAEIIDVPPGNYTVSYIGEDEEKIISLRQALRTALDQMVAEVRKQAEIQQRLIEEENFAMKGLIYSGAFLLGLYQQGESIVTGAADLVESTGKSIFEIHVASWRLVAHLAMGDVEAMRAELQQMMSTASESINGIVEAFETLAIIAEDEEARTLLADFPARYFNAHSSVERTRMAGRLSFEILLALATFGSGAVVSAIAKSNYFVKATRALEKLTQATKLKRLNHTRPGTTEQAKLDRIPKVDTDIETVKPIKSVAPAAVALKIDPKDHVQILLDDFLSDAPEHVKNNYRVAIRDGNPYIARRDQSVSDQLQYVDGQIVFASNKIDIPNQVLERLKVDHQSLSPEARKKLKELEAVRNQAVAKRDAALKSGNAEHLKEAYQDMRAASEELGEEAARIFVEQNYPGAKSLSAKLITKGKQGQFDQIYQTEDGRLLVIEAKGGSATWGSRMAGKDRAQQGSRAYMESIFENYKDKLTEYKADPKYDDPKESKFNEQVKELSKMLDKYEIALDMKGVIDNPIEYIGIQQKASDSGIKEVMNITIFDIDY